MAPPPTRFASGTVPPPVRGEPLPSILHVAARIRRQTAERMFAQANPGEEEVEVLHVDLGEDEIALDEADLTLVD